MASRDERERSKHLDAIERRLRHGLIYLRLSFKVYGRSGDLPPWPHHENARHLESHIRSLVDQGRGERFELLDEFTHAHVLIERRSGRRIVVRGGDEQTDFGQRVLALAEKAERHDLTYTVSEKQLPMVIDDDHRAIFASGGERGGKTQAMALWAVVQWCMFGCVGGLGLWVAPTRKETQRAVRKLVTGEGGNPPLLPKELVSFYPSSDTTTKQWIQLVDGFRIRLEYTDARRKGGNIKGDQYEFACIDEACEIEWIEVWRIIRGRMIGPDGRRRQIFLASTPEPGHWAFDEIVTPVDVGSKPRYTYGHLSLVDNPFIPLSEVMEMIEDKGGAGDPVCQRHVFGLWVSLGAKLWIKYDAKRHVRSFDSLSDLGLRDITPAVAARFWGDTRVPTDILGGQDYNVRPMSSALFKIGRATDGREVIVFFDEIVTNDLGSYDHGFQISNTANVLAAGDHYGPIPIACDPSGDKMNVGLHKGLNDSFTDREDLSAAGHDVRAAYVGLERGKPGLPPQKDSLNLCHRLFRADRIIIHPRCREAIKSFSKQEATPRGTIAKEPGSAEDRLSSITDAFRYLICALYWGELWGDDNTHEELDEYGFPAAVAVA